MARIALRHVLVVLVLLPAVACGAAADRGDTGPSAFSGAQLDPSSLDAPDVSGLDRLPPLPSTAPAYVVRSSGEAGLRTVAERHHGGTVERGAFAGADSDLTSYAVRDGWFFAHRNHLALAAGVSDPDAQWQFESRAIRSRGRLDEDQYNARRPCDEPLPQAHVDASVAFFRNLGLTVRHTGEPLCAPRAATLTFTVALGDAAPHGYAVSTFSDRADGTVLRASCRLFVASDAVDVALAPAAVIQHRARTGTEMPGYPWCDCALEVDPGELHHVPVNVTPAGAAEPVWALLPAVRLRSRASQPFAPRPAYVLAVASRVLAGERAAARAGRYDAQPQPTAPGPCARLQLRVGACLSAARVRPGELVAVVATAQDLLPPVEGCDPALVVTVDGEDPVVVPSAFAGAVWRDYVTFEQPGVHRIVARATARCPSYAPSAGLDDPYDDHVELILTVD